MYGIFFTINQKIYSGFGKQFIEGDILLNIKQKLKKKRKLKDYFHQLKRNKTIKNYKIFICEDKICFYDKMAYYISGITKHKTQFNEKDAQKYIRYLNMIYLKDELYRTDNHIGILIQ